MNGQIESRQREKREQRRRHELPDHHDRERALGIDHVLDD